MNLAGYRHMGQVLAGPGSTAGGSLTADPMQMDDAAAAFADGSGGCQLWGAANALGCAADEDLQERSAEEQEAEAACLFQEMEDDDWSLD